MANKHMLNLLKYGGNGVKERETRPENQNWSPVQPIEKKFDVRGEQVAAPLDDSYLASSGSKPKMTDHQSGPAKGLAYKTISPRAPEKSD